MVVRSSPGGGRLIPSAVRPARVRSPVRSHCEPAPAAGTPGPVIARINGDVGKILASSEMRERLISMGQVAGGESPEAFGKFIREEIARYAKIIKAANITLE